MEEKKMNMIPVVMANELGVAQSENLCFALSCSFEG